MSCCIDLPPLWVTASRLEEALRRSGHPHRAADVLIRFPIGCKLMIDSAVRILSLANQLDHCTGRVRLDFLEGEPGALGYLNRMGFFDHLSGNVEVTPSRPEYSGAQLYRGGNSGLVEIARINKNDRDRKLPDRLTAVVGQSCRSRRDVNELCGAAWTIFAELIDNVFSHSQTPLDPRNFAFRNAPANQTRNSILRKLESARTRSKDVLKNVWRNCVWSGSCHHFRQWFSAACWWFRAGF